MTQEERKERKREYQRKYYAKNKERIAQYYQENKEKKAEYDKQHRQKNKDKIAEYSKQYREGHKEYFKKWAEEHKESIVKSQKKYYKTKRGRAKNLAKAYVMCDKAQGFDTSGNITEYWIVENLFSGQECYYCGEKDWTKLGADRIDNDKPHTPDNVVCACGDCNRKRQDKYSVEDFKQKRYEPV